MSDVKADGGVNDLSGVRGWLLAPLLMLFYSTISSGFALKEKIAPVFVGDVWRALTTPGEDAYQWFWAPLLLSEAVLSVLLTTISIIVVWLFVNRNKLLPKFIVGLYVYASLVAVAEYLASYFLLYPVMPGIYFIMENDLMAQTYSNIIWALIWIPYFLRSKRVRNTFV